jgi:hypothetical protein
MPDEQKHADAAKAADEQKRVDAVHKAEAAAAKAAEPVVVEYPKYVTNKDGKKVVVNSADEEKAAGKPPDVKK